MTAPGTEVPSTDAPLTTTETGTSTTESSITTESTTPSGTTSSAETTTTPAESTTTSAESTTSSAESTTASAETTTTSAESTTTAAETTTISMEMTTKIDQTTSVPEENCPKLEDGQISLVCPTGFRRHPKYCDLFYQCTMDPQTYNMKILVMRCPNETLYDSRKIQCLPQEETEEQCQGELSKKETLRDFQLNYAPPPVSFFKIFILSPFAS